jgi:hypothetical protein
MLGSALGTRPGEFLQSWKAALTNNMGALQRRPQRSSGRNDNEKICFHPRDGPSYVVQYLASR